MKLKTYIVVLSVLTAGILTSCGGGETASKDSNDAAPVEIFTPKAKANPLGIGPLKEALVLGEIDAELAAKGEEVFTQKCTACHKMDKRHVGPGLAGVIDRRNPTWVMNMILNPDNMVKEDPVAKALLAEYLSPMANQNLTEEEARSVLEYFRKYDQEKPQ